MQQVHPNQSAIKIDGERTSRGEIRVSLGRSFLLPWLTQSRLHGLDARGA
jgi:hypothetical protein